MNHGLRWVFACLIGLCAAQVYGQNGEFDTVRRTGGGENGTTSQGNIVTESSTTYEIVLSQNNLEQKIPINEIKWIDFQGSPLAMANANKFAYAGEWKKLQEALDRMKVDNLQSGARADFQFYECLGPAKEALRGEGDLSKAAGMLKKWHDDHPKHYRYLQACELLGDLAVALGNLEFAKTYYTEVARAPIPEYKLRAAVALGRAYLSQGKIDEADKTFDVGLNAKADNEALNAAAQVGKAQCLADKDPEKAVKVIKDAIEATDASDAEQSARAYDALGYAYQKLFVTSKKAEDRKEAFYAYLKVDLLYKESGDAHAEALYYLTKLWAAQQKGERSNDARDTLNKQYPNSRWKAKLAADDAPKASR